LFLLCAATAAVPRDGRFLVADTSPKLKGHSLLLLFAVHSCGSSPGINFHGSRRTAALHTRTSECRYGTPGFQ